MRLEAASGTADPFAAAWQLAVDLRDAGRTRDESYAVFDAAHNVHRSDIDDRAYDAVLDVIDFIVGRCSPHSKL